MREYAFARTGRNLLRVFGAMHPSDGVFLLLRYFHEGGAWRKPPVFSPEVLAGDILDKYDIPLRPVATSGITVGLGPTTMMDYGAYFDPLAEQYREITANFADAAGVPVGLTGSRLVGLANPASDLDLVVFSDDHSVGRQLVSTRWPGDSLPAISSTFRRITGLHGTAIPRIRERNIFKAFVGIGGREVKLDLHYASKTNIVHRASGVQTSTTIRQRSLPPMMLTVVDASRRHVFPGHLVCRDRDGQLIELWIKDHLLSLLLPDDQVTVAIDEIYVGDETRLVGNEVVAVCLR